MMVAMPSICLVDTNIVIAANGPELLEEKQYCCIAPCIELLEHITKGKCKLVLDSKQEIIKEYQNKLNANPQNGTGCAFIKWVWDNEYNTTKIDLVSITPEGDSYTEFPQHPDLEKFDRSDRKFVAAANVHPQKPPIAQALDYKWCGWEAALKKAGISFHFVHEEHTRTGYQAKYAHTME